VHKLDKTPKTSSIIGELGKTVERLHGNTATRVQTVPVKEEFSGKIIWQGDVEVFDLTDNPKLARGVGKEIIKTIRFRGGDLKRYFESAASRNKREFSEWVHETLLRQAIEK
jgi:hypothetical protein